MSNPIHTFLSCVGKRDPYPSKEQNDQWGGAMTLALYLCDIGKPPTYVCLLPSGPPAADNTIERAKETRLLLKEALPEAQIDLVPVEIQDASRPAQVLPALTKAVRDWRARIDAPNLRYYVNTSSGTPQMQDCWLHFLQTNVLPPERTELFQVLDPSRLLPNEPRVRPYDRALWFEEWALVRIREHLRHHRFAEAADEWAGLSQWASTDSRRTTAPAWQRLFRAYARWDQADFQGATEDLRARVLDCLPQPVVQLSREQARYTSALQNSLQDLPVRETADLLLELYLAARRRRDQEQLPDALMRAWRCVEGAHYFYARQRCALEPRRPDRSSSREEARQFAEQVGKANWAHSWTVPELKTLFIDALNDSKYRYWLDTEIDGMSVSKALDTVRESRNQTPCGHGCEPVDRQLSERALQLAWSSLKDLAGVPSERLSRSPFAPDRLSEVLLPALEVI